PLELGGWGLGLVPRLADFPSPGLGRVPDQRLVVVQGELGRDPLLQFEDEEAGLRLYLARLGGLCRLANDRFVVVQGELGRDPFLQLYDPESGLLLRLSIPRGLPPLPAPS